MKITATKLAAEARVCTLCAAELPHDPRPLFQVDVGARILIAGQAPGIRAHESGIPFDDPSGDRLRLWMGIDRTTFYDPEQIAILPMGFCFPGRGASGDLPPRPICAKTWRHRFLPILHDIRLTLVIGQYAQQWHLSNQHVNVTRTVADWRTYGHCIPLPHPSPRNNAWLKKNPWFESELLPETQKKGRQKSPLTVMLARARRDLSYETWFLLAEYGGSQRILMPRKCGTASTPAKMSRSAQSDLSQLGAKVAARD